MKLFHKVTFFTFLMIFSIYFDANSQSIQSEIKDLSKGADIIVIGKVIDQKSQWNSEKSKIYTLVTLQVEEFLKGSTNQNRVIITHLGGEVGAVGETYSHVPTFKDDEDVLVFLKKSDKDQTLRVFEGEGGKMTLHLDKISGEKVTSKNINASEIKKEIKNNVERQ